MLPNDSRLSHVFIFSNTLQDLLLGVVHHQHNKQSLRMTLDSGHYQRG
jgi:hypothetical protein